MPIMTASSCRATFTCRTTRRPCRRWSRCMAAAGCKARAAPSNIGGPIWPPAASRFFRSLIALPERPRPFPRRCRTCSPACNSCAARPAVAALSGKKFLGAYPSDPFAATDAAVKALVGVYGIYDVTAMWTNYQIQGGRENNIQKFMGLPPMENRQSYFDASPISYATFANNGIGVLLVTGTEDDLVDRKVQTDPFTLALKQANFFVRPCIVHGAPHYWMNDPIDEPHSYGAFLAPRLLRFLAEKL